MIERLHVVDGTFELFRAHFSKRPPHSVKGVDKKATLGVCQAMFSLLRDASEKCTHLAIAFDNPIVSFRNDLFDAYKSDEGMDPVLRSQFDGVEEACRALGFVVWSMREFEADDALATACVKYGAQVGQVRILTPDKDVGQMLDGEHIVQVDRIRQKTIGEAEFRARRGIDPASMPDFLGLVGDTADGIPGLAGWGEKGAATVLAEYKHIEAIPASASDWKVKVTRAEALARTLAEQREDALLYRKLAVLRTDVPLSETLDDLRVRKVPRAAYEKLRDELETTSLNAEGLLEGS